MVERDSRFFSDKFYSRRKILRNTLRAGVGLALYAGLKHGIRGNPPKIEAEPFTMNHDLATLLQQAEVDSGILLSNEDRLFIETNFEFFSQKRLEQAHRAGNSFEGIDEAVRKKAQIIDIDALDENGTVYAEHGFIPGVEIDDVIPGSNFKGFIPGVNIGKLYISSGLIIDPGELEIRLGKPVELKSVLKQIGQRSTPELRLGAKIEFKRGEFKESTVNDVFGNIEEFDVPSVILTRGPREYEVTDNIRIIRNLNNLALIGLKAA